MNLIQTQYHLRDLPNEQVKAFANGRDPSAVPEWLAAAEMQRRERVEMASSKAPDKSVKERLEETMGLKALQAQRQQMAGQKMGEQAMAMPTIPENVPQPEDQPEVQEAAAGGLMSGIAKLPVEMFHQAAYAGGGIIAFDRGGDIPDNAKKWAELSLGKNGVTSPMAAELLQKIREPEEAIETPEQLIAKRKALLEQQGVRPAGEGQERRIQERGVAYEQEKKDRALNNLISSMSSFSRPNITGQGQGSDYANTAVQGFEAGRAEDAKFRDTQDKLQDAIEVQRRAELVGDVDTAQKANIEQKKIREEIRKSKLSAMGEGARIEANQAAAGLGYLSDQDKIKSAENIARINRESAERVASMNRKPIPQVVAVAEWLMEKDDKLSREDALRMGAEIANTGKLDAVDAKRTADADKAFKDQNKQDIMLAALEKDPAKKKALQDALDAKKEKIYKEYKVKPADGVSSEQGGATQSGNTRVRLDAQGNIIK
jgi:hypothetical protein